MINSNLINKSSNTYFQLIEKVGSKGRYQWIILLIISLQTFMIGLILQAIHYFFIKLSPVCNISKLTNNNCQIQACKNCDGTRQKCQAYFGYINNLSYGFNTYFFCKQNLILTIKLVQKLTLVGIFFGLLIFSYFADNHGRRKSAIYGWIINLCGLIIICISWNIYIAGLGLFFIGTGISNLINFGLLIFAQEVQYQLRQNFSAFIILSFYLGKTAMTGIFYLIPRWKYISAFILLIGSILCNILLTKVQETPRFLLKSGQEYALKKLGLISQINKLIENPLTSQDLQLINSSQMNFDQSQKENKNKKRTLLQLFIYDSIKFQSICCCALSFFLTTLNYNPTFLITLIQSNFYIQNLTISLSQLLGSLLAYFIIKKRRKIIGLFILAILISITFIQYYINFQKNNNQNYLHLSLIIAFKCTLSLYNTIFMVWITEIYPQTIRATGLGFASTFSIISIILVEFLFKLSEYLNYDPKIYFLIFAALGIVVMIPLKQTTNSSLLEQIQEQIILKNSLYQSFVRRNSLIKTQIIIQGYNERPVQSGII